MSVAGIPLLAPEAHLLEALPDVAKGGTLELFGDDLSGAPEAAQDGWQRFDRTDSSGASIVTLARAVETRGGDLDYEVEVLQGPIALRITRVPEAGGPIPTDVPQLRNWLVANAMTGDLREAVVAAGDPPPPLAVLPEFNATGRAGSTRVIMAFDYLDAKAAVGQISLRRTPGFEVQYKSRVVSAPDFSGGPTLGEVNIAGDSRRAVVLPLGSHRELQLTPEMLQGRTRLDLAVAPLLGTDAKSIQPANLIVSLFQGDEVYAAEIVQVDPIARSADRHWQEVSIDLIKVSVAGPATLSLDATGTSGAANAERALAVAGLTLQGGPAAKGEPVRPNVFLVSLDTVRRDRVGMPGALPSLTPAMDAFAQEALVFENTESVAPFTLPTHGTVFSGLLPTVHGGLDVATPMRNKSPMVAEILRAAGWSTAAFTGGGYLSPDFGFVRGFERYTVHDPLITTEGLPPLELKEGAVARDLSQEDWDNQLRLEAAFSLKWPAVQNWIERKSSAPKFLFLHTYAAHQYLPPKRIYDEELAGTQSKLTFGPALGELTNARFEREPPSEADVEHLRRLYGAAVRSADEGFGQFLDYLEASGLDKTSYVIVFSDHGEELFEHGDFGHSNDLRQSLLAVPLMIRGPGIEPARIPEPVSLLDLAPTLLTLAGQPVEPGFGGRSLIDVRAGVFDVAARVARSEAGVFSEVSHHTFFKDSLLFEKYKLVRDYGPTGRGETFTDRLYDLSSDLGEFTDLAAERPKLVAELAKRLEAWRAHADAQAAGEEASAEVSEATRSQLEDLGYL